MKDVFELFLVSILSMILKMVCLPSSSVVSIRIRKRLIYRPKVYIDPHMKKQFDVI